MSQSRRDFFIHEYHPCILDGKCFFFFKARYIRINKKFVSVERNYTKKYAGEVFMSEI